MTGARYFLAFLLLAAALADEGFYETSNAAVSADSNVDLLSPPILTNRIVTSHIYQAGTVDAIFATYVGAFSNSGPHSLGSFARGSTVTVAIQLERKIGPLLKVVLQNGGVDGWLLDSMTCRIEDTLYRIPGADRWLEDADLTGPLYENSFSPNAQTDQASRSNIELPVADSLLVYSDNGFTTNGE